MYTECAYKCTFWQEAPVSITFGRHVSHRKNICIRNPLVESCRLIYLWVKSEGGGGSGGVRVFWNLPPKICWATPTKF